MRTIPLGIAIAALAIGAAAAQTSPTPGQTQPVAPGTPPAASSGSQATRPLVPGTPGVGTPGAGTAGTGTAGAGMTGANTPAGMTNNNPSGTTGSSPTDTNGAVNTSSANSPTPAKGANSFSQGEARRRIARSGFANVTSLRKDQNGVWRGMAQKNGQQVNVWLDYRGNVGQQ